VNEYVVVGIPEDKRPLEDLGVHEDNIKTDLIKDGRAWKGFV
jgi:hypothetical protein